MQITGCGSGRFRFSRRTANPPVRFVRAKLVSGAAAEDPAVMDRVARAKKRYKCFGKKQKRFLWSVGAAEKIKDFAMKNLNNLAL